MFVVKVRTRLNELFVILFIVIVIIISLNRSIYLKLAEYFPKKGALLMITDGYRDKLAIKRDHAYIFS